MTESAENYYSSCCRLCLTDGALSHIFSAYVDPQSLVENINAFLNVQISESDVISKMLCETCYTKITNWESYRRSCLRNQAKLTANAILAQNSKGNEIIHIKEEPIDQDLDYPDEDDDIKQELYDGDSNAASDMGYDLPPPPLTPHPPGIENPSELVEASLDDVSKRQCTVCNKLLSTPGNRRKHERCMHGLHGGQTKKYRKRKRSQSIGPVTDYLEENHNIIEHEDDDDDDGLEIEIEVLPSKTNALIVPEKDREKLQFAAGLDLQSKSMPTKQPELTTIEKKYLEKCRMMITMFETNVCACHNNSYSTKKLMGHLRSLYAWFPCYTCYNCMVTYDGRSARMRHATLCPRGNQEQLIHLSEMRARTSDKIRLYQNYKCIDCNYLFGFYEDYCEHVDEFHVQPDGPYSCLCGKEFDNSDLFKRHIHKTCYLNYYCDICFLLTPNLEEFKQHCVEYHDKDEDFEFIVRDEAFNVYNNIEIGEVLLKGLENKKQRLSLQQQKRLESLEESAEEELIEANGNEEDEDGSANSSAFKEGNTPCPKCDKTYSSYHNMLRHLNISHGVTVPVKRTQLTACNICGNNFSSYSNMMRHKKIHNRIEVKIICKICSMRFKTNEELNEHIRMAHDVRLTKGPPRCSECGETFKNAVLLEDHKRIVHDLQCGECKKLFDTLDQLEQHRSVHLNIKLSRDPNSQNYRRVISDDIFCGICKKSFNSAGELHSHMRLHQKMPTLIIEDVEELEKFDEKTARNYTCIDCNKYYISYKSLWSHNKKHHPDRTTKRGFPKDCAICQKQITSQAAWVAHKMSHLNPKQERPASRDSTPPHQAVDSNDESDYHTCKKCFKVFVTKSSLANHMRLHGITMPTSRTASKMAKGTKTVWCDICHQACHGIAELNKHKLEHLNEESDVSQDSNSTVPSITAHKIKQVYCKYCKIPFDSTDLLDQHMYEEHEEGSRDKPHNDKAGKKHKCQLCGKFFINMAGLASHMNWHKRTKTDKMVIMQGRMEKKDNGNIVNKPKTVVFYKCSTCGDNFDDDTKLQLHILEIHRNVLATFKCTLCNAEFKSQADCAAHEKVHAKKADKIGVDCKYCNKTFNRSDYLNIHISKIHPEHAVIGTFKCNQCDRAFEKQNALTIHLKVHERVSLAGKQSEPTPNNNKTYKFSCSICHFGFDVPKELRDHIIAKHPF